MLETGDFDFLSKKEKDVLAVECSVEQIIVCEGDFGEWSSTLHPRVFIKISKKNGWSRCPYCNRKFVLGSL